MAYLCAKLFPVDGLAAGVSRLGGLELLRVSAATNPIKGKYSFEKIAPPSRDGEGSAADFVCPMFLLCRCFLCFRRGRAAFPFCLGQSGVHALSCRNGLFQFLDHGHQGLADNHERVPWSRDAKGAHCFGDLLVMLRAHGCIELADSLLSLVLAAFRLTLRFRGTSLAAQHIGLGDFPASGSQDEVGDNLIRGLVGGVPVTSPVTCHGLGHVSVEVLGFIPGDINWHD